MAFLIGKRYLFLVVLIIISLLSSSLHAREFLRFSQTVNTNINEDNSPQFITEENRAYGLYGREEKEAKTHPFSAATVNGSPPPPLPKNYNPVAYLTVAEDINEDSEEKIPNQRPFSAATVKGSPPPPLPKNYNPVAYLTVAEDPEEDKTFVSNQKEEEVGDATFGHSTTAKNNPYFRNGHTQEDIANLEDDDNKNYFDTSDLLNENLYPSQKLDKFGNNKLFNNNNNGEYYQPEEEEEKSEPSSQTTTNNKYYKESSQYYGNSQQQQNEENKFNNYFNNEETSRFHKSYSKNDQKESLPQGMSDTRTLQNGMYHYNPYSNQYNKNHPYSYYNNFRNNENANRYQQQEEEYQTISQDEEMP